MSASYCLMVENTVPSQWFITDPRHFRSWLPTAKREKPLALVELKQKHFHLFLLWFIVPSRYRRLHFLHCGRSSFIPSSPESLQKQILREYERKYIKFFNLKAPRSRFEYHCFPCYVLEFKWKMIFLYESPKKLCLTWNEIRLSFSKYGFLTANVIKHFISYFLFSYYCSQCRLSFTWHFFLLLLINYSAHFRSLS